MAHVGADGGDQVAGVGRVPTPGGGRGKIGLKMKF
jgi:hypothetical protein